MPWIFSPCCHKTWWEILWLLITRIIKVRKGISHVQLLYTTKKHHPNSAFTYDQPLNVSCKRASLSPSSTNQVVPGCDKLSQKVENSSTFCNKICTGCAFYRPKAKSLCSRWYIYRVLRDSCVILANKKSVLTQHATTWFLQTTINVLL